MSLDFIPHCSAQKRGIIISWIWYIKFIWSQTLFVATSRILMKSKGASSSMLEIPKQNRWKKTKKQKKNSGECKRNKRKIKLYKKSISGNVKSARSFTLAIHRAPVLSREGLLVISQNLFFLDILKCPHSAPHVPTSLVGRRKPYSRVV